MAQANLQSVWHLSRGQETQSGISYQELLLLAELGHLRPNDLLWKPGFDGWRPADSVPGILIPPLPASVPSPKALSNQIIASKMGIWSSVAAQQIARSMKHLLLIARGYNTHWRRTYRQFLWPRFNPGIQYQGVAAGLLILLVLLGLFVGLLAMRASFAIATAPVMEDLAFQQEFQTSAAEPLRTAVPPESKKILVNRSNSEVFRVHPVQTQAIISEDSAPVEVMQSEAVPLPTRKPVGASQSPYGEGAGTKARIAKRKVRQSVPTPFGSFGYN
jgi:hypothetical protein